MTRSKRARRRAYLHGEPSPSLNVTVIGGVFALLIIGALAGVLVLQIMGGGLPGTRTQAASSISQGQQMVQATGTAFGAENQATPRVDVATAKTLYDQGALFVDARNIGEFQNGHITGAVNIPSFEVTQKAGLLPADRAAPIVAYCA